MDLKAAKDYVEYLMKIGKSWPIKAPYGEPLFLMKKKNGHLRGLLLTILN